MRRLAPLDGPPRRDDHEEKGNPMSSASTPLATQVAVVTGAGRGIGAAIARKLADLGASVVASGRTLAALDQTVQKILRAGNRAERWQCDVVSRAAVDRLTQHIRERYGRVNILVNNAGVGGFAGPLHQLS